ncbi:outer membrane protein [Legionella sainthelensi]|uniref:outer membrane protein n=1 Tax=Legionella sainthelensi TaxID=28087 RepID=UPI0021652E1D|nr:outer membrane beta-barrel protein [Legionella sainthelensi]
MSVRNTLFSLVSCLSLSSLATAGTMGPISSEVQGFHPVISVFGGPAWFDVSTKTRTFLGSDDDKFIYHNKNNNQANGFVGVFLGGEFQLPYKKLFLQGGVEYDYLGNSRVKGSNSVGIEPQTYSYYDYSWNVQTQQVLAVAKLLTTTELNLGTVRQFFPYFSVGLGAAFNNANDFRTRIEELGVNVPPIFRNHSQSAFSYTLGVGVDTPINQQIRLGLGYRFSDFGAASLTKGEVVLNQYRAPVDFALSTPHIYANQLIVQLTYLA